MKDTMGHLMSITLADGTLQFNIHSRESAHTDYSPSMWNTGIRVYSCGLEKARPTQMVCKRNVLLQSIHINIQTSCGQLIPFAVLSIHPVVLLCERKGEVH